MTEAELLRLWHTRDELYSNRRIRGVFIPLSDAEEAAVVAYRWGEMDAVSGDTKQAREALAVWTPPVRMP